jgi:type II secretory pathway pseudopilin PulG
MSHRGYTIVETIVVLGILVFLSAIVLTSLRSVRDAQALKISREYTWLTLRNAREATLASRGDTAYGVRLASTSITQFTGGSYSTSSVSNIVTLFEPNIMLSWSLTGSTSDIRYARLSGEPSATGTLRVTNTRTGASSTLTINASGIVDPL